MGQAARAWPRNGIYKIDRDGAWMVPSRSHPGYFVRVRWEPDPETPGRCWTCTCPKGKAAGIATAGEACRHVGLVAIAEADDGIAPRPSAPPNVAALVD